MISIKDYYIIIIIYVLIGLVFFYLGGSKKIGSVSLLLISVFLTPLVATVVFVLSPKRIDYKVFRYKCDRCGFSFTENTKYCPYCEKEGRKMRLRRVKRTMT